MQETITPTGVCPHCAKSIPANQLEQHISARHVPARYVEKLINHSAIRALYGAVCRGEQKTVSQIQYRQYRSVEKEIKRLCQIYGDRAPRTDLAEALSRCETIRKAIATGSLRIMPKPPKRGAESSNRLTVYSGGAPGSGKRS
jgi:hypothetical protein